MKRCVWTGCLVALLGMIVGCGSETHEGLITKTISAMDEAGNQVGNIRSRVDAAVKKSTEEETKLDLTAATKATDDLKKVGEEFQKIKRAVEQVRNQVSEEDRKKNAENNRAKINDAFKNLVDNREKLRKSLDAAETLRGGQYKTMVTDLRKKIIDAESPFESLARQ